jgi:hypothetical protein
MAVTRICRDEDCPECGWPETYAEVDFDKPTPGADAIGCSRCGWRVEAEEPAKPTSEVSMCGTCTGTGLIHRPNTHRDLVRCPACAGARVR